MSTFSKSLSFAVLLLMACSAATSPNLDADVEGDADVDALDADQDVLPDSDLCTPTGPEAPDFCRDGLDNDCDDLVDCDDDECGETPECQPPLTNESECLEGSEGCCWNGTDDDSDGVVDCADDDCRRTERCCGVEISHVDQSNGRLDVDYWQLFGGREEPVFDDDGWLIDWRSTSNTSGYATHSPVDLNYDLSFQFTARVVEPSACISPLDCSGFVGLALGPAPAASGVEPMINLAVVMTSAEQVAVVRAGRILHAFGIEREPDDTEPSEYTVTVTTRPVTIGGDQGFQVEVRVPGAREVCHADGSSLGCPELEHWSSSELALWAEDNRLLDGGRGTFPMLLGRGANVSLSDALGSTVRVGIERCANYGAWRLSEPLEVIDAEDVCWAVGAVGSPSIAPFHSGRLAMVVHGTTRDVSVSGYGANNFSLAHLETEVGATEGFVDDQPHGDIRRRPFDTLFDVNCQGPQDWVGELCAAVPEHLEPPAEGCDSQLSRRSPFILPWPRDEQILFSEALEPGSPNSALRFGVLAFDDWDLTIPAGSLTPEMLGDEPAYRSLRDPAGLCFDLEDEECADGSFVIIFVGEEEPAAGEWDGDDLLAEHYNPTLGYARSVVPILSGPENPLAGRELSEPWLMIDRASEMAFLWVTTRLPGQPSQLDLLLASTAGIDVHNVGPSVLAGLEWTPWAGNPVLSGEFLEQVFASAEVALDCSSRCELGGATFHLERLEGLDRLHMWLEIAQVPDSGGPIRQAIYHFIQPLSSTE